LVTNADQEVELQAQGWNPIKKQWLIIDD
jgi:hypothetical protein